MHDLSYRAISNVLHHGKSPLAGLGNTRVIRSANNCVSFDTSSLAKFGKNQFVSQINRFLPRGKRPLIHFPCGYRDPIYKNVCIVSLSGVIDTLLRHSATTAPTPALCYPPDHCDLTSCRVVMILRRVSPKRWLSMNRARNRPAPQMHLRLDMGNRVGQKRL